MRVIELVGDHYVMGRQHAQQVHELRPRILEAMRRRLSGLTADEVGLGPYVEELTCMWREVAPATLDMMRGIADGLALRWDAFLRYTIAGYLESRLRSGAHGDGCTVWAASASVTRDGAPILVKNRDYRPNHPMLACLARAQPDRGYRYLYATSAGSPAVFSSGVNEAGLAVADTHVTSLDVGPGVARYSAMMEILEHHDQVSSAIAYLRQVPHIGDGTLVLADAGGRLAVFESAHRAHEVIQAEDFVISTNHFVSPGLSGPWTDVGRAEVRGHSLSRHARVAAALQAAAGEVDTAWAQRLMSDHGGPRPTTAYRRHNAICRHSRVDPPWVTISIAVYLPQERKLLFGNDRPCRVVLEAWPVS
jgi:hypothetical protein